MRRGSFGDKSGGFLDGIHPLLTLTLSVAFVVNGLLWSDARSLGAYLGLIVAIMGLARLGPSMLRMGRIMVPIALVIASVNYFGFQDPNTALLSGMRIVLFGLSYVFFSATTTPSELVGALGPRVPSRYALGLILSFRFIPVLLRELQDIIVSYRMRPVRARLPLHQRMYRSIMVPFVVRVLSISDEIHAGVLTRGYEEDAPRSRYQSFPLHAIDAGAAVFTALSVLLAVVL